MSARRAAQVDAKHTRPSAVRRGPIALETIPDMDDPTTDAASDQTASVPVVTVRYWASARAAAGVAQEQLPGGTLAAVLDAAREVHSGQPRFAQVLKLCSFLVGDEPLGSRDPTTVAVRNGDVVEALPPFAGG